MDTFSRDLLSQSPFKFDKPSGSNWNTQELKWLQVKIEKDSPIPDVLGFGRENALKPDSKVALYLAENLGASWWKIGHWKGKLPSFYRGLLQLDEPNVVQKGYVRSSPIPESRESSPESESSPPLSPATEEILLRHKDADWEQRSKSPSPSVEVGLREDEAEKRKAWEAKQAAIAQNPDDSDKPEADVRDAVISFMDIVLNSYLEVDEDLKLSILYA